MPPKRKLTVKKKRKSVPKGEHQECPTDAEWPTMKPYTMFVVNDDEEDDENRAETKFKIQDMVVILSPEAEQERNRSKTGRASQENCWYGQIQDIRARNNDATDVWVKIQWFYHLKDAKSVVTSFDISKCHPSRELVFSDHLDYIHTSAVDGHADIDFYDEASLEPTEPSKLYWRYTVKIRTRLIHPKPTMTCVCHNPYDPNDKQEVMHFCPRPSCRMSYHETCLLARDHFDQEMKPTARGLALLTSSPDSDDVFVLPNAQPKKRARRNSSTDVDRSSIAVTEDLLKGIPKKLVEIAEQPIVKGGMFHSLTGNVQDVLKARHLVYQALQDTKTDPKWRTMVNAKKAILQFPNSEMSFTCPKCGSAI